MGGPDACAMSAADRIAHPSMTPPGAAAAGAATVEALAAAPPASVDVDDESCPWQATPESARMHASSIARFIGGERLRESPTPRHSETRDVRDTSARRAHGVP